MSECISCGEEAPERCSNSHRACGHHCDHTWTHDSCCWCGAVFGDESDPNFGKPAVPLDDQREQFQRIWQITEQAALASPPDWFSLDDARRWCDGRDATVEQIREEMSHLLDAFVPERELETGDQTIAEVAEWTHKEASAVIGCDMPVDVGRLI